MRSAFFLRWSQVSCMRIQSASYLRKFDFATAPSRTAAALSGTAVERGVLNLSLVSPKYDFCSWLLFPKAHRSVMEELLCFR